MSDCLLIPCRCFLLLFACESRDFSALPRRSTLNHIDTKTQKCPTVKTQKNLISAIKIYILFNCFPSLFPCESTACFHCLICLIVVCVRPSCFPDHLSKARIDSQVEGSYFPSEVNPGTTKPGLRNAQDPESTQGQTHLRSDSPFIPDTEAVTNLATPV
jgi:hypothetical protein